MDHSGGNLTKHRKNIAVLWLLIAIAVLGLLGRLVFLMVFRSEHYSQMALELHQRERSIKAARGRILDAKGKVIADNRTVCTVSVIYNQVKDREKVTDELSEILGIDRETVQKKVEKRSSREIIKTNVDKETGDAVRKLELPGVKVDEDYKRYYPYGSLASKVLGFTGGDNQGVIGLEVQYDAYLKGTNGKILTMTDARGVEMENGAEDRIEPVAGNDLRISLDMEIQQYAEQLAYQTLEKKNAKKVSIIVMNPQNGEIYAMVNVPEFDLNDPFTPDQNLRSESLRNQAAERDKTVKQQELLNAMWRNTCINDTYEPGSTFKIITAAAGLEEGVVKLTDPFSCPGFRVVEDRRIRCHKAGGHGSEDFTKALENSCNPALMEMGLRMGVDRFYQCFSDYGLLSLTGIDIPGEAGTIMHKLDKIGAVELATMSFGQSIQITPLQLMRAVSAGINGGRLVTPHFALEKKNPVTKEITEYEYKEKAGAVSKETSQTLREVLEAVVAEGTGKNGQVEGYRVGGKTATSEKLPRRSGKYISSFLGFAPANHPQILGLVLIDEPQGTYYGGVIAAPVMAEIFQNVLPYLDNL